MDRAVSPHIEIHAVTGSDFDEISALLERNGLSGTGISEPNVAVFVAHVNGTIAGTAALEIYPDGALLRSVAVDPAYRNLNLGHTLTKTAVEKARKAGIRQVFLLTETASDFFPRLGFQFVTREDVPLGVGSSIQFRSMCPDTARIMVLQLK